MFRPALAALVIAAAPALAQDAETVVATVNGQPITLVQMAAARQGLPDQVTEGLSDAALWDMLLDQMIRQSVLAEAGEAHVTAGDRARIEIERRGYLAAMALEPIAAHQPTDAEITAAYAKYYGDAGPQMEYHAAHILLETPEAAQDVRKRLDAGANFGALAEERSTGPSGPNKGDLGWFTADQMVPEFGDAVKAMKKGQIAGPVQTQFGWHLIHLIDSRIKPTPKLDAVRDQLVMQIRRDRVDAEVARLMDAAKIERKPGLDAGLINNTDVLVEK